MADDWATHVRDWFDVNEPLRAGGAPDGFDDGVQPPPDEGLKAAAGG